jgi:leucyl-tRNA synthetase
MPWCDADGSRRRGRGRSFRVFTTRPDTSYGMTFCVLAPEHPLVDEITTDDRRAEVEAFVERARPPPRSTGSPPSGDEERGVFTGAYARNPFTGRPCRVPGRLRARHLRHRGHHGRAGEDQRDWDFATIFGLPIIETVQRPDGWEGEAYTGDGCT